MYKRQLSGLAAGVPVDEAYIAREMDKRRAAGRLSTKRTEPDRVHFLSGVYKGFTTGTAVTLVIENTNTRSEDYEKTQDLLRPGHADWTAHLKYRGFQDARGGGHFSGRLTAPLVAACAILKQMLEKRGVVIGTHLAQCAGVEDEPLSLIHICCPKAFTTRRSGIGPRCGTATASLAPRCRLATTRNETVSVLAFLGARGRLSCSLFAIGKAPSLKRDARLFWPRGMPCGAPRTAACKGIINDIISQTAAKGKPRRRRAAHRAPCIKM